VKRHLLTVLLAFCSLGQAQDKASCSSQLDLSVKQAMRLMAPMMSGPTSQGTSYGVSSSKCITEKRCGMIDLLLAPLELQADEAIVELQRKKVSAFKAFFVEMKPYENDTCAIGERFPKVLEEVRVLSGMQQKRVDELSQSLYRVVTPQAMK